MKIKVKDESQTMYATKFWFNSNGKLGGVATWESSSDRIQALLRANTPTGVISKRLGVSEALVVSMAEIEQFAPREF